MKITPAHDFNDYGVGRRHDLPMPSVLDAEACVTFAELDEQMTEWPTDYERVQQAEATKPT